jgi:hypothetical protein
VFAVCRPVIRSEIAKYRNSPSTNNQPTMSYGLATKIASAQESTTYDFSHVSSAAILTIISSVFSKPFALSEMIRLTFIVGGGKSTRAKYDEGALAACVNGLKGCGYTEDKGAGCVLESAGSYKIQHDTGKNVKTVVVFPRISGTAVREIEVEHHVDDEEESELIPRGSVGYKIAISPLPTFSNLLSQHCPTYMQKKRCLRTLSGLLTIQDSIENKLMVGQQLDQSEKVFYDSATDLKEKMENVQKEATRHIDEGNLTREERKTLVEMNEKKIQSLLKENSSAHVAEQLKKALARKEMLSGILNEAHLPPLRLENQINTLRKKLVPLKALEEASHQRYLSVSETAALSEMNDLEREIERLEAACCGWFEEEEVFAMRVQASRDQFERVVAARAAKKGGGGKLASRPVTGGSTNWILPGESKSKAKNNAWGVGSAKKRSTKGGAVFSAMMMDSSSEEESEEDHEQVVAVRRSSVPRYVSEQTNNFLSSPTSVPNSKSVGSASLSIDSASIKSFATACSKIRVPQTRHSNDATGETEGTKVKSKKKKKNNKSKKCGDDDDHDAIALSNKDDTATKDCTITTVARGAGESTVSQSLAVFVSALFQLLCAILSASFVMLTGLISGGKNSKNKNKKKAG